MNHIERTWHIKDTTDSPVKEKILRSRGIDPEEAEKFLFPSLSDLADPFLFLDMKKAVDRVKQAIINKERIVIFGDYDVDGVTGTAILVRALLKLGALVSYRLPHRVQDGYGLKKHFIDDIVEKNVHLLITVDNGIASFKEITYANEKGIDVIITDHHSVPENIPPALAILHPKKEGEQYPFKHLSGSGVAFVFSTALMREIGKDAEDHFCHEMLDMVMLGTIADCVPLIGENRILAWHGLRQLPHTTHTGLEHLMRIAGVNKEKIDTHTIEYIIAPRLNAGGRMATALDALHLFLFDDGKGKELAQKLHDLNAQRQMETQKIFEEAEAKLERETKGKVIVLEGGWHIGVIGIVASKLAEKYNLPTIILGKKGESYVASCRSDGRTNIIELLSHFKEYFPHYGGHEGAAGFDIPQEKYGQFKKEILLFTKDRTEKQADALPLFIEASLSGKDISWDLVHFIEQMAPYGESNPEPLLLVEQAVVQDVRLVGNEQHIKFFLQKDHTTLEAIAFHAPSGWKHITVGQQINVAGKLEKNEFNGKTKINLIVEDIKP
jgi:single-stranded-DNA-specific exonuclease